jgi:methylmalonyl-CoA mutase
MAAAIAAGLVERRLGEARLAREERVRTRARPLVGVSDFADAAERDPTVLRAVEPPNPRFGMRAESEVFERLRDVADGWARAHGGAPRLFLARLGPPRESSARAAFVRGAASAGGFEAVGPDALADAETAAREFGASGAGIAVLCGADARYDAEAAALATALRAAGARQVLVAGRPGEHAEALRAAGVGGWMHAGADIAALLARAQLAAQVHP